MKPKSEPAAPRKPRLALLIATGFGLGKLPRAPGTWGSLGGVLAVYVVLWALTISLFLLLSRTIFGKTYMGFTVSTSIGEIHIDPLVFLYGPFLLLVAGV